MHYWAADSSERQQFKYREQILQQDIFFLIPNIRNLIGGIYCFFKAAEQLGLIERISAILQMRAMNVLIKR